MILKTGEYLCLEGDKASSLYIVKSGLLSGVSNDCSTLHYYGPGSIVGEFSLLENAPREQSLRAVEDSEILIIEQSVLQSTLEQKPGWISSILTFLAARNHIAQENKKRSDLIQALPSLLFVFKSHLQESGSDNIRLSTLCECVAAINGTSVHDVDKLLLSLQDLGVVKIQGEQIQDKVIRAESLQIIPLLYETLRYRALHQKVSPNILSMTDQMVLSTFIKLARESKAPLHDGLYAISTEQLKSEAKKSMHGFTLTMRTLAPLVQKQLLQPSSSYDIHAPLESIDFFYADFDKILDLLELNRIFPLLDKKLV